MRGGWEGGIGGVRSTQIKWHADQIHNELFLKQLTTDGSNARPNNNNNNSRAKRNWVNRRREWLEKGLGTGNWELGAWLGKGLRLVVETGLETGRGFVCWGWELPLSKSKTFANCRRHLTASWTRATATATLTATIMFATYCPGNQVLSEERTTRNELIECKTTLEYPRSVMAIT